MATKEIKIPEVKVAAPAAKKIAPAKKAAPVKKAPAPKKPVAKKPAAPKNPPKVGMVVEHAGRQVKDSDLVKCAQKLWVAAGKDAAKVKTIDLYVKPDDGAIYCVVNGEAVGKYDL